QPPAPARRSCGRRRDRRLGSHPRPARAASVREPRQACRSRRAGTSIRAVGPRAVAGADGAGDCVRSGRAALRARRLFPLMGDASPRIDAVDAVLIDLGVSSPQLDDSARGFSYRLDGPLDMRMDTTRGETAAALVARADVRELTRVIRDYGEERFAQSIARAI